MNGKRFGIIAAITAAVVVFGGSPAFAADTTAPPPATCAGANMSTSAGSCADVLSSSSEAFTDDASYAAVGTSGKILVKFRVSGGMKLTASEKHNANCKMVSKPSQVKSSASCVRATRGFKFTNSGTRSNGATATWADFVGNPDSSTPNAKWLKFVKRHGQWYKVGSNLGSTPSTGNCGNKVSFKTPLPKRTAKTVIQVRSFASWTFSGHVAVHSHGVSKSTSTSWCNQNGVSASATASGSGEGDAQAAASFMVKGLTKIQAWVAGTKANLSNQLKLSAKTSAEASSKVNASSKATTMVSCTGSTPPPPPPSFNAPTVSASARACVNVGEQTGVIDVVGNNPNNASASGSFTVGGKSLNVGTVAANASVTGSLSGFAPGTYSGTFTLGSPISKSATFSVTVLQCSTPPPPENPSVSIGQKNDVDVNDTATVCADYNVPGTNSGTLTFTSDFGSYPGGTTFTVSGTGTKCTTYKAPSEVPSSGHDTLTVSLRDNVTGLSDNTPSNNSTNITINSSPPPPL